MNEIFNPITLSLVVGAMVFAIAYANANRFLEWLRWQSIGTRDYIVERLGLMFIEVTPNKVLLTMVVVSRAASGVARYGERHGTSRRCLLRTGG